MLDLVIANGTVVDGTGADQFVGHIGVKDGKVAVVDRSGGPAPEAAETIDATGLLVTPGFVDCHTHYDGQVTWDDMLQPSSNHGVTTVVMGNCGVGFAPVQPGKEDWLIQLMEGVEDIPGAALSEGISWGWESFPEYLDVVEQRELAIDVAAHVGTLIAVLVYFWRDVGQMAVGTGRLCLGRLDQGGRLALYLVLATIPALAVGYLIDQQLGINLRNPAIVGWALIGFGILLYAADRIGMTIRQIEHMALGHALLIGLAQVLAFIPGTSRSGITMTAGRLLGYERAEAARFSFLLSIPAISAAGVWKGWELYQVGDPSILNDALMTAGFCAVTGFLAIAVLMAWLKRAGFGPFVVYRLLLGGFVLWLVYSGQLAAAGVTG